MATLVVYGGADGYLVGGPGAVYLTARSTYTAYSPGGAVFEVGQDFTTPNYSCYEGFVQFAPSLPAASVVSATVLSLYATDVAHNLTPFTLKARIKDYGAAVESTDWVAGASLSGCALRASLSTAGMGIGYKDFVTSTDFASSGNVRLIIDSDRMEAASVPTANEWLLFAGSAAAGTTTDPKMTYTYLSYSFAGGYLNGALGRPTAWPRCLTPAEMQADFGSGMVIFDRSLDQGTAVIEGVVETRTGTRVPAHHVRAGWWIQHLEAGAGKPLLITGHSVDLAGKKNALTIGKDWMEAEIGVRMADLLAIPPTVVPDAVERDAVDPYTPDAAVEPDTVTDDYTYVDPGEDAVEKDVKDVMTDPGSVPDAPWPSDGPITLGEYNARGGRGGFTDDEWTRRMASMYGSGTSSDSNIGFGEH